MTTATLPAPEEFPGPHDDRTSRLSTILTFLLSCPCTADAFMMSSAPLLDVINHSHRPVLTLCCLMPHHTRPEYLSFVLPYNFVLDRFWHEPQMRRRTSKHTETCKRLVKEWSFYVSKAKCLSKVFVSIKGVYFQAEVRRFVSCIAIERQGFVLRLEANCCLRIGRILHRTPDELAHLPHADARTSADIRLFPLGSHPPKTL